MKIRFATAALTALLFVPGIWGQTGAPKTAGPAPSRVAVMNVQQAISGTAEGKQATEELRAKFAPRQAELANLQKQIEDLQQRLRSGATTLSDEEKARLARQGNQLTRAFQRKQQDLQDDGNEAQQEVVDRIGRKMLNVLDKFARQNGYGVILDTSSQSTPVVYASNQVDITQQIIKLYDEAYPVKSAAPAHPAPSKPSRH